MNEGTREFKFLTKGESTGSQDERCHSHRGSKERCWKGRGWGDGVTLGGHSRDVENIPEPRRPTRAVDPAGGNGSHHALLRPPTA